MWQTTPEGIIIPIKVIPKASKNAIMGWQNGELKIRLAAQPEKGQANEELLSFLSKEFNIAKSNIKIISGFSSRHKRVWVSDVGLAIKFLDNLLKN